MDILTLSRTARSIVGMGQTPISFLDFVINGHPIYSKLRELNYDFVSCLGWMRPPFDKYSREKLKLERDAEFPRNRVGLYVCPECVDVLCGGITTLITEQSDTITWSKFAFDSGYENEPDLEYFEYLDGLGPYVFDKKDYLKTISAQT